MRNRWWIGAAVLGVWLVMPGFAHAQCRHTIINELGSGWSATAAGADITIDATSGGVSITAAKTLRCGGTFKNVGTAAMRCGPTGQSIDSTHGALLNPGDYVNFGSEFQEVWKCIRTTGSSTSVNVVEAVP